MHGQQLCLKAARIVATNFWLFGCAWCPWRAGPLRPCSGLLAFAAVLATLYLADALLADWTGVYGFQVRQAVLCGGGLIGAEWVHEPTRDSSADAGGVAHARAYLRQTGGDAEAAVLLVCPSCGCPVAEGSLVASGQPSHLVSLWQSGETGYPGKWHPYDVFIATYRLPAAAPSATGPGELRLQPPLPPLGLEALTEWWKVDSGAPAQPPQLPQAQEAGAAPAAAGASSDGRGRPAGAPPIVVCAQIRGEPFVGGHAARWIRAWGQALARQGASVLRIYFHTPVTEALMQDVRSSASTLLEQLTDAVSGMGVLAEVVVPKWLTHEMISNTESSGQLWGINECLLSSQVRGARFVLNVDLDELPYLGSFASLASLADAADRQGYDAVTFPNIFFSWKVCFGVHGVTDVDPQHYLCRSARPDCSDHLLRGFEHRCLGPRGRRKYLARVSAFQHLQVHTPDAALGRVWHAMESDGLFVRHYQGAFANDAACEHQHAWGGCSAETCAAAGEGYVCDNSTSAGA